MIRPAKFRLWTREEGGQEKKKVAAQCHWCFNLLSLENLQMRIFLGLENLWQGWGGNDQVKTVSISTQISITSSLNRKIINLFSYLKLSRNIKPQGPSILESSFGLRQCGNVHSPGSACILKVQYIFTPRKSVFCDLTHIQRGELLWNNWLHM